MRRVLRAAGMDLRHASLANAQQLGETMVARGGEALGRATFPASVRDAKYSQRTTSSELGPTATYYDRRDECCDTRLSDPFCDQLEAIAVCLIVALVDRKVETESTIDLNVNVPWTMGRVSDISYSRQVVIDLKMFPPRSTILSGLSRRRKNVFCVSLVQSRQSETLRPT